MSKTTVGIQLVRLLEQYGVDTVFGIPGVHTAEIYRGLAASSIHHVTPRDEQDAGFMADGYARVSGRPGVCFLITGPGLTNAITPMAQARADSIPMLIVSGVNALSTQGLYQGYLHELPDQAAMIKTLALSSECLERPEELPALIDRAFAVLKQGRPGPVHIEIPIDLMEAAVDDRLAARVGLAPRKPDPAAIEAARDLCAKAEKPLILAGGGAVWAQGEIRNLAEKLDAPVVTTVNARGLLAGHPLSVPASPSLPAVRGLMAGADLVIAIGTQLGPTDYDMYGDDGFELPENLIRIDVDETAVPSGAAGHLFICGDASAVVQSLVVALGEKPAPGTGAQRAADTRRAAQDGLSPVLRSQIAVLSTLKTTLPEVPIVGDSTQLIYAGNLYWEAAGPRQWFNAATGYGALGYGPPAAIGASIGLGRAPVVCLVGDGGFQFCLAALGAAKDENAPVIFVVWNNHGYQEIEEYMLAREITPVGVKPGAPDFCKIAEAYGIPAQSIRMADRAAQNPDDGPFDPEPLVNALKLARSTDGPTLIEIVTT